MSLKLQIEDDIKTAMRAKDKDELRALRAIKSLILLAETEKGHDGEMMPETELKILTKAANQRREALEIYRQQGRDDLAEKEEAELKVVERYLPKQLTEDEMRAELQKIIQQTGASGAKDMGKVMGSASKSLAGRAEGKTIADMVKSLLNQMG
ncbi:GatB/YqeY domain-containing protein [Cesiribacter sp. SM1]|uniref:GatB/YqeY domain-containing protein n=1 Tax=Cesiribacter sp. SM1 TaxID=2861196 RepID=UPI001CD52811|nr:GatB/YqeY domain-containing protein [Cesiribacter sp. SM1]